MTLLVSIGGIAIIASGLILCVSFSRSLLGTLIPTSPHLASSYQGSMHNTATGGTTTFTLTSIVQTSIGQGQEEISGTMTFSSGLQGSGTFTGTVGSDNSIQFTVTSDYSSGAAIDLDFTGSIKSNTMSGNYSGFNSGAGSFAEETGTWTASPNTTSSLFFSGGGANQVTLGFSRWIASKNDRRH